MSTAKLQLQLKHILVQQRYEAEDLLRMLQEGKNFEDLARKFSVCSSAKNGGDLGLVALGRLDPDFAEAAELLKAGETSRVVKSRFGYHIIFRK